MRGAHTLMVPVVMSIVTLLVATAADAACDLPTNLTNLSQCKGSGRDVVITSSGACSAVKVDKSFTGSNALGTVTINKGGRLYVPDQTLQIEVDKIELAGLLQSGTASCPIGTANKTNQVTMTFTGARACTSGNCGGNNKGIFVNAGGQLQLFGLKGTKKLEQSWTYLGQPTDEGDSTLYLADDVATGAGAWQNGDWIAVATTSFSPFETEFVRIKRPEVNDTELGKTKLTLDQHQLQHVHFGGPDPGKPSSANFDAGARWNYGVDERAEVGLISRNIKLTAKVPSDDSDASRYWGGEIKIVKGFSLVQIQGVEIEKFGKDQLGSYPIHFHELGPLAVNTALVSANSIHHSYNKCITVHSTENLTITNNVCARIVGHIFYQEIGDEHNTTYTRNLGLGAMSHDFEIYAATPDARKKLIGEHFWKGDNLAQAASRDFNGYNGLRIPNTDTQDNPTHGSCFKPDPGGSGSAVDPFTSNFVLSSSITPTHRKCSAGEYYAEPASGFWLINPGTKLTDNSIAGCQGVGRAFWYVPPAEVLDKTRFGPAKEQELLGLQFKLVGEFKNNRAHGCFAGLYAETEFGVRSQVLNPRQGGVAGGQPVIAKFEGFTATRIRKRGVWLRPFWYVLSDARLATSTENVTLVTAGGLEGVAPGVWALLENSVVVGVSTNNADRFGPCPYDNSAFRGRPPELGPKSGGHLGCIDQTPIPPGQTFRGGDIVSGGYSDPRRFLIGYMIYDGPVRMENNRFVNFNVDITPLLTDADTTFLSDYSKTFKFPNVPPYDGVNFVYEGDAALGWFQSNQSMYPVSTVGKGFTFTNVDLRHQIYTEVVNVGEFRDGDQNTAIIDLDGSLSGLVLVDKSNQRVSNAGPISLNNLPFNTAFNSVDECSSEGGQNKLFEGRPTGLMSPGSVASLTFEALFPKPDVPDGRHDQKLVFTKDSKDFAGTEFEGYSAMTLLGRDGRGVWEPKVTSGYGYTVKALKGAPPGEQVLGAGIPKVINVTPGDLVKPDIDTNPFYVRLGVCYTSEDKSTNSGHPSSASQFTIQRGYKSLGGGGVPTIVDPKLNLYWNQLNNRFNAETCFDLNSLHPENLGPKGCPAHGVTAMPPGGCQLPSTRGTGVNLNDCIYPTTTLLPADCIDATDSRCKNPLKKQDGSPDLGRYFYDPSTGMLFFYVAQERPNTRGPSPLGSCNADGTGDETCPDFGAQRESFYTCPPEGCVTYVVRLNDDTYTPAESTCTPYPKYEQPAPTPTFRLAYAGTNQVVQRVPPGGEGGNDKKFPHYTDGRGLQCK
jgi:hypothetical protein